MRSGFTIIETLIVLILVGITAVFAIPGFQNLWSKTHEKVLADQLLTGINLARSEAQKTESIVILSKNSSEWKNGFKISNFQKILYSYQNGYLNGNVYWRAFPNNKESLEYLPSGFSNFENGTFWYCAKNAKTPSWAIVINQAGRARLVFGTLEGLGCRVG